MSYFDADGNSENDDAIRGILESANVDASKVGLKVVDSREMKNDPSSE